MTSLPVGATGFTTCLEASETSFEETMVIDQSPYC